MLCNVAAKVAVTVAAPETVQVVAFEEVQPDQLVNVKPWLGAAVRVTDPLKVAMHVPELLPKPATVQLMPAGLLVTVPVPLPELTTVNSPGVPPGG